VQIISVLHNVMFCWGISFLNLPVTAFFRIWFILFFLGSQLQQYVCLQYAIQLQYNIVSYDRVTQTCRKRLKLLNT